MFNLRGNPLERSQDRGKDDTVQLRAVMFCLTFCPVFFVWFTSRTNTCRHMRVRTTCPPHLTLPPLTITGTSRTSGTAQRPGLAPAAELALPAPRWRRRRAVPVPAVLADVHAPQQPGAACADPHGGPALPLPLLRGLLRPEADPVAPRAHPHGREAPQVRPLPAHLHPALHPGQAPQEAPAGARGRGRPVSRHPPPLLSTGRSSIYEWWTAVTVAVSTRNSSINPSECAWLCSPLAPGAG